VVLAAKHHLQLLAFQFDACGFERTLGFSGGFGFFGAFLFGHAQEQPRFFKTFAQMLIAAELQLDAVLFLEDGLRGVRAFPEVGLGGLFEECFLACGQFGDVKDASRVYRRGLPYRSVVRASR
ncbi:MAG: hypothetical protein ACREQN_13030, partial [Candidatus Binataceae bacterium]